MKGHIVKRGETSWSLVFDLGRGEDGKRKQKWITVTGTKRDAERELARLLTEAQSGLFIEPTRITVEQYLEYWLENYAKTNVVAKTLETYTEFIRLYIIPKLGRLALAKLQPAHIQQYYTQMLASGKRQSDGGLSARSVLHHHRVLRQALQQAVKWQFLGRNPADAVVPPRPATTEMKVLDEAQSARLVEKIQGDRLYIPILLAITTGMRRGEVLGLRWDDVDLDAARLHVQQALGRTKQGLHFAPPKTKKSRRSVTLPSLLVEALREHKQRQQELKDLLGPAYQDQGLINTEADGSPWSPNAFSKAFRVFLIKCELPIVRLHDLRHTHATSLLKHGVHAKIVSERLGHSTIALTLDTYSHVLPGMQDEVAKQVDTSLRAALDAARIKNKSEESN